jgi:tRNA-dihydrouridine synthase A
MYPYVEELLGKGASLHYISRHTLGLFNGEQGARQYRRFLSENAFKKDSGVEVLEQALSMMESVA